MERTEAVDADPGLRERRTAMRAALRRDRRSPVNPAVRGLGARIDQWAQVGLLVLLAAGCWRVVAPFFPAVLLAAAIASSAWPLHRRVRAVFGRHLLLSSLLSCVLMVLAALGPVLLLLTSVADGAAWTLGAVERGLAQGLPTLPGWIERLPLAGAPLSQWWTEVRGDPQRLHALLAYASGPARQAVLVSGRVLGNAAAQVLLTALLLFFFFRNGETLARALRLAALRIGGRFALELVETARASVNGVIFGVLGAGIAQAMVATLGFAILGVPNPFLLGALTFVLSMIPIGPPLVWGGAAVWLFQHGHPGAALFMVVYGLLGISTIDNVLKPLLISRASHLPFVLTLIGVAGGVIGFGVTGVFLGPTLIALTVDLGSHWLRRTLKTTAC